MLYRRSLQYRATPSDTEKLLSIPSLIQGGCRRGSNALFKGLQMGSFQAFVTCSSSYNSILSSCMGLITSDNTPGAVVGRAQPLQATWRGHP
eukprot:15259-Heterococcus_DN1.PRE.1